MDQTELDHEVYEMEMDESHRQRLNLGTYNDYQNTCDNLIGEIQQLLPIAKTSNDFEVLSILCHIVKECKECECIYVTIKNF